MVRGIVKAPGVNLLLPSDPSRRIRTLAPGTSVDVLDGRQWLRVEIDGLAGLVPAAAVDLAESSPRSSEPTDHAGDSSAAFAPVGAPGTSGLARLQGCRQFVGDAALVHTDFHGALRRLDGYAALAEAKIHVTHSFRRRDARLDGAVVPPAKRSNHLVGHAIDMNIVLPGEWLNSRRLQPDRFRELPAAARYLIQQIRNDAELRWGGDFLRTDPVHIDDNLYRRDPDLWMRKLREI